MEDNDKDDTDDKGISSLELDSHLGFSRGHQRHWPHDDDDNEVENNKEEDNEVEDDKVEDKDKDVDNIKDDTNDKSISTQGLDKDQGFLRGHQGYQDHRTHDEDEEVMMTRRRMTRWRTTTRTMTTTRTTPMTRISQLMD